MFKRRHDAANNRDGAISLNLTVISFGVLFVCHTTAAFLFVSLQDLKLLYKNPDGDVSPRLDLFRTHLFVRHFHPLL